MLRFFNFGKRSVAASLLCLLVLLTGCAAGMSSQSSAALPWEVWEPGATFRPSLSLSEEQMDILEKKYYALCEARLKDPKTPYPQIMFPEDAEGSPAFNTIIQQLYLLPPTAVIDFHSSKGCTDLTCTDSSHYHWCESSCKKAEHYHFPYQWKGLT